MNVPISMAQVIQIGASRRAVPKCCPWCGNNPPMASQLHGKFVVACDTDDCAVRPQVTATTLDEVWKLWNGRI